MAKTSKFRHARAQVAKPDSHFLNVNPTGAIWDCGNFIACNQSYVAVPWHLNGSAAVFRHDQFGKLPSSVPVVSGHAGPIIDLGFSPFDDSLLFTASEDATIRGWRIPDGGLLSSDLAPVVDLRGHSKKVGILAFHPSAANVLASAGMDYTINLWDVETQQSRAQLKGATEHILSVNWNLDGSLLNTTTKDKKLSLLDSRTGSVVASAESHAGSKTQRSVWAKRKNLIVTVGFDKTQRREVMVWDCRSLTKPLKAEELDQSSSLTIPLYDEDTNMLYVGGKGDGSVKYYEVTSEAPHLLSCSTFTSADQVKGLCLMPKKTLDVKQCEIARFYLLGGKSMYPVRMILPRKQSEVEFQEDVFVPTFASEPAMSAREFFDDKKNVEPRLMDLRGLFDGGACSVRGAQEFASPVTPHSPGTLPSAATAAIDKPEAAGEQPSGSEESQGKETPQTAPPSTAAEAKPVTPVTADPPAASPCAAPIAETSDKVATPTTESAPLPDLKSEVEQARKRVEDLRKQLSDAESELERKVAELQRSSGDNSAVAPATEPI